MTALYEQSTDVRAERVVVRPARGDEMPTVERLAGVPSTAAAAAREPQLLAAVVAVVGGEVVGAAAGYWTRDGGVAARVGVTAGWKGLGVGGFLGRVLGCRLNELVQLA